MADTSFINWPFFESRHKVLFESAKEWSAKLPNHPESHESAREESKKLVAELGSSGFLNHCIPDLSKPAARLDVRSLCLLRETFAYHSGLLDFAFAMQGLGSGPISLFGTEDQKRRYLPHVASGKMISTFALSEAEAGSDVSSIKCQAVKKGDNFVLSGEKTWISNAGIADFYVVFARTGESGSKGISAFIVDTTSPGFSLKKRIDVCSPHPLGTITFDNCVVSSSNLLGELGQGFKIAMATLDVFRSTVGAAALGFARRALDEAVNHSKNRVLFGQKLGDFQMTQSAIAEMATEIDASALLIYRAAWVKDSGAERVTREAAMAKMYATEAAQRVIDKAVQILGGRGVVFGEIVERLYRDIRPLRIYEGTTEIQKIVIASQVLSK